MPGLVQALRDGYALANERNLFETNATTRRQEVVNNYYRDTADQLFNARVASGIDPIAAQFQGRRDGLGINQSNRNLGGALQATFATAPLAAAASFGGDNSLAQSLLGNFGITGTNINPSALLGLGGQLGASNSQNQILALRRALFGDGNAFREGVPQPAPVPPPTVFDDSTADADSADSAFVPRVTTAQATGFAQGVNGPR